MTSAPGGSSCLEQQNLLGLLAGLRSCPAAAGASCMDTGMGMSVIPFPASWQFHTAYKGDAERVFSGGSSSGSQISPGSVWSFKQFHSQVYFSPGGLAVAVSVWFGASQPRLPPPLPP